MSVYYVKEIGNHGKEKCTQGMFSAKSHAELFWMIDQRYDPYDFMFAKIPNWEFGVWFDSLDNVCQEGVLDEDDIDNVEMTNFHFDDSYGPTVSFEPNSGIKLNWKTWKNGTSGQEWVKTNEFGEY